MISHQLFFFKKKKKTSLYYNFSILYIVIVFVFSSPYLNVVGLLILTHAHIYYCLITLLLWTLILELNIEEIN